MNRIYFRRARKVAVASRPASQNTFAVVASLDANLRKLGFALDNKLAARLLVTPVAEVAAIHADLIAEAKEIKGVRRYSPMYPNFPRQVMEASEAELYVNAIFHYFGDAVSLRILPKYDKLARPELDFDESKVTLVSLGSQNDFTDLMASLMQSKSAFSETDRNDIAALQLGDFVVAYSQSAGSLANRENKATVGALAISSGIHLIHELDTATDVLRLAVAMSDGDVSLAEKTNFRSFTRPARRLLLGLLDQVNDPIEDMYRHVQTWKRLGERLHPGEFNQFPKTQMAFNAVRNDDSFEGFNARVERMLAEKNLIPAVYLLVLRPGELVRRLDHLLRFSPFTQRFVLDRLEEVAANASPTVLVQARNAFINREKSVRTFFPKGSVAKMQNIEDDRPALAANVRASVVDILTNALHENFKDRGDLGGSWVDPALKSIAIPFGARSTSKSIRTVGRGSRLPMGDDTRIARFFIWWKDGECRTDLDLSAVLFDEFFTHAGDIAYYNLRGSGAVHSGDITSAPNGASEFIDIDVDTLLGRGVRYVAMTVHVYTGQEFVELPECFAGFMERKDMASGEIYDPRTVTNKLDLTAKSRAATPFIFDLHTREAIWVDLSMKVGGRGSNAYNTSGQITNTVQAMTSLTPPTLYALFTDHAIARGGLVSKDKAVTKFAVDGDVSPFDTEFILDKLL